jgi:hypothetical protein
VGCTFALWGKVLLCHSATRCVAPTFLACLEFLPRIRIFEATAFLPAWMLPKADTDRGFNESKVASQGVDRCSAMILFLI